MDLINFYWYILSDLHKCTMLCLYFMKYRWLSHISNEICTGTTIVILFETYDANCDLWNVFFQWFNTLDSVENDRNYVYLYLLNYCCTRFWFKRLYLPGLLFFEQVLGEHVFTWPKLRSSYNLTDIFVLNVLLIKATHGWFDELIQLCHKYEVRR